ncbi:MAG: serine/threonine protein kinase [Microcoleus sp. PH2017_25_DOB_D_A]|uniref:serine/threonine-protein kinase n=1 Tax=unclassified Microcoleus TaxID=2642155 RepID=UPI001D981D8E|nr:MULTISPECIES: serine/threonine-protein kinase [unclassified Microcoleus]TAE15628.1 MAG: serine/threonine protein kinase [Oscillatoriales cyanobacterium]MCC3489771.1 serine/threonine protein kinase [Microcoleus sp. PH2017_16_JOR_D_A]MCC3514057.1 serine/threonine protein kinase [Microcoleus sp. PH2017_18_LLB_O_A]MCC3536981.1 serine/threonine protein kinase [Microcoleus sp. PH2017_25_DOB_D_A]MCC3549313.1 serine/threonine protein kinase [Microcoleus sp. PH2017_24_DOB_U_A]
MIVGQTLNRRYHIIRFLGQGGFGETYLAEDRDRPNYPPCVVKRLMPQSNERSVLDIAKRLFASESLVLENLGKHDRIPRLLAKFDENQEFYLVQELIVGHDLSDELNPHHQMGARGVQFSESKVIELLYDILEVLQFVHQHKIVHRDIKPSNLMRRDADGKIVLIDFGAVKQISSQLNHATGQPRTVPIGTPGYMPNEQENGHPKLCSDIYAVGMVGIQALTGVFPHELPKDSQTLEVIWRDRVSVSPKLAAILDKMVRHQWKQRYQSADQALQAIKPLAVSSVSPTVASPAPSWPSLNLSKIPKMLIGLVALGFVTLTVIFVVQNYPQFMRIQPYPQPTATPRKKGIF